MYDKSYTRYQIHCCWKGIPHRGAIVSRLTWATTPRFLETEALNKIRPIDPGTFYSLVASRKVPWCCCFSPISAKATYKSTCTVTLRTAGPLTLPHPGCGHLQAFRPTQATEFGTSISYFCHLSQDGFLWQEAKSDGFCVRLQGEYAEVAAVVLAYYFCLHITGKWRGGGWEARLAGVHGWAEIWMGGIQGSPFILLTALLIPNVWSLRCSYREALFSVFIP